MLTFACIFANPKSKSWSFCPALPVVYAIVDEPAFNTPSSPSLSASSAVVSLVVTVLPPNAASAKSILN